MLIAVLALVAAACGGPAETAEDASDLLTASVAPAEAADDFVVTTEYQGQIEPRRRSRVGFDLAGVLRSVTVDEGAAVTRGAPLARLDVDRLVVRQRSVEAAVAEAKTALDLAESTLVRFEQALAREAVSPQDMDEARRRRDGAAAALRRTEAELDAVGVDLAKSTLRAPFAGTVTQRFADEGEAVAPGQRILELIETAAPRVRVGVPLDLASGPALAEQVTFKVGGAVISGTRLADLPEQSPQTRTVDLLFELDQPLDQLRAGQVARLEVERPATVNGIVLPSRALTESSRGLWSCLVAVEEKTESEHDTYVLEQRVVEILEIASSNNEPQVMVRGALQEGELVVMEGLHRLVAGQRVRLNQADQPGSSDVTATATGSSP